VIDEITNIDKDIIIEKLNLANEIASFFLNYIEMIEDNLDTILENFKEYGADSRFSNLQNRKKRKEKVGMLIGFVETVDRFFNTEDYFTKIGIQYMSYLKNNFVNHNWDMYREYNENSFDKIRELI